MHVIRNNQLEEVDDSDTDVDYVLESPTQQYSTHINMIPLQSAVQAPRLFYGARFVNQALSLENGEAPLVQNLDPRDKEGRSFDQILGNQMGIQRARANGQVLKVTPDSIKVRYEDGEEADHDVYNSFAFNQKSVSGSTEIVIRRRSGELWRGPIESYEWRRTDCVAAYDPTTLRSAWQRVIRKVEHTNDKQMLRVGYTSGRSVVVTEDHSLLHFDGHRIAPILPGSCLIGRTKSPVVFGNIRGRKLQQGDHDLGLLLGLYLAEGDIPFSTAHSKTGARSLACVRIAVTGEARRTQVDDLFRRLGHSPHARSAGRAGFTDHPRRDWMVAHCGRGAGNKFIHPELLSGSLDLRLGILQGFMAGDGCMESDSNGALHLHAAITSERLRDDLVLLLNGMGIFTTLFFAGRKRYSDKWNDAYGFRVMSRHLSKLDRWFFYEDRHSSYLGWLSSSYSSSPFECITVPGVSASKDTLRPLGLADVGPGRQSDHVRKSGVGGGLGISKDSAARAEGPYALLGTSDILWDTVESVEIAPHEDIVYDLSVENAEAFAVCGGLLVHNSGISSRALVKPGDAVAKGGMLAATNYTDDEGTINMGLNARVGLFPWTGNTMDDAIAISQSFADRFKALQYKVLKQDKSDNLKTDLNHFRALFPTRFTKETLANFDNNGVVKPGTVLKSGDPVLLATSPRTLSSAGANVGKLSKAMQQSRRDASMLWEGKGEATVVASRMTKNGYKVVLKYAKAMEEGDKAVFRQGAKGTISRIIADDRMPHTADGKPLDVMLNPLSLNSRANPATAHEIRLGKVARALGKPIKIPSYLPKGENWNTFIAAQEAAAGVNPMETVHDPVTGRDLGAPVSVGYGYMNRLHHTSESKGSARGVAGYDCFDAATEVLTARGWVAWPAVTADDLLCTPEFDCVTAAFEQPSRLVAYDYDGDLVTYQSRHLDWAVTPNHKFLKVRKESGSRRMVTAEELRDAAMATIPQFGFKAPGYSPDFKLIPATTNGRLLRNREPLRIPFNVYAALMGWWLAEGSVQVSTARVYIWQHESINPDHSEAIRALLEQVVGSAPLSHVRKGWRVTDRRLAEFLAGYGTSCYNKRLPRDIVEADDEAVAAFMDAFTNGDGCDGVYTKNDSRTKLNTIREIGSTSKLMMDDIQEMLMRRGSGFVVKRTKSGGREVRFPDRDAVYVGAPFYSGAVHGVRKQATVVSGRGKARYAGAWGTQRYVGKVYCATTRTGLLVVRRNGKPCVTGNSNQQPLRGGHSEGAQAKRFSGLENAAAMSAGAYAFMRENSTLRGQRNDNYWRDLRAGRPTQTPGTPFVFTKFRALLSGAGINTRDLGKGRIGLAPFTDRDLDSHNPVDIAHGGIVNPKDLTKPIVGGLFDPRIVTGDRWGRIRLPRPVPNPAYSEAIRTLLGMTKNEMDAVLRGESELSPKLKQRLGLDTASETP